jgi:hypothetical protein
VEVHVSGKEAPIGDGDSWEEGFKLYKSDSIRYTRKEYEHGMGFDHREKQEDRWKKECAATLPFNVLPVGWVSLAHGLRVGGSVN